jgi:hypothetical protein
MTITVFCNEVKGKSMLALCRDLDVQYKTAFVLAHKLREAMASRTATGKKALRFSNGMRDDPARSRPIQSGPPSREVAVVRQRDRFAQNAQLVLTNEDL